MYSDLLQEYRGDFGKGRSVDEIVDWVDALPAMPDVVARALQLVDDPNTTAETLAEVIQRDPALSSVILRFANSASVAQRTQITTVAAAVMVVGMAKIKTMLLGSTLRNWNENFGSIEKLVWDKSLGAASAAHVLSEKLNKKYRDELHLTGLLHNIGQIVMLSHKETAVSYTAVLGRIHDNNEDFVTAEREVIGFSHPLVGALVAKKWRLPHSTCQAILHHHAPFEGIDGEQDEKIAVLKLAVGIGLAGGMGCPQGYSVDFDEMDTVGRAIGFEQEALPEKLRSCIVETKSRFGTEAAAYA